MAGFRHSPHNLMWLCACAIFVDTSSQNLDQAFVLKAAENVIRHYYSSNNITTQGLTGEEFNLFLESATAQTNEVIRSVLARCPQKNSNCTKQTECLGIAEKFHSFTNGSRLTNHTFLEALPSVLEAMASDNCTNEVGKESNLARNTNRPTFGEAWGYSIGFGTLVIVISNIGACLGPAMNKRFFRRVLQFLVAMGAGSLASTSLLILLPEAFDIIAFVDLADYVWKATVSIISIYVFFCLERLMKTFMYQKKTLKRNISIIVEEPDVNGIDDTSLTPLSKINAEYSAHSHGPPGDDNGDRKTLAWMVMIGDVIHNFVDGMSIGAAFCEDTALGVSISLAVVCEALPHELADIAILIHSGLSIRKALIINFISACFCMIGLAVGVTLGSMSQQASKWIFAMAGGLFLYVPLVDMLPDMSSHVDTLLVSGSTEARVVVFLHACGLTVGAGIVIFIVNVSSYIVIH